jgi:hypothetical protein
MLDAAGLLAEYDQWSRSVAGKDVDNSTTAFLLHRRGTRAIDAVERVYGVAADAVPKLRAVLDKGGWSELRPVLVDALAVCEAVEEAAQWE